MSLERPIVLEPHGRMRVPVQLFLQSDLAPGDATLRELRALAAATGAHTHIAALPDVHSKARNPAPTGTVLASRDHLVPFAVDKGINCGMRMLRTNIPASACTDEVLDALFSDLQRRVPIRSTQRATFSSSPRPGFTVSVSEPGYPISRCSCISVLPRSSG